LGRKNFYQNGFRANRKLEAIKEAPLICEEEGGDIIMVKVADGFVR